MHNRNASGEYSTSDLYLAAFLQTAGAPMLRHTRNGSGKVTFIFDSSVVNVEELTQSWYAQTARITALQFANNIKNLKAICHMS